MMKQTVLMKWFAGWLRHPYTVPTIVTAYVKTFPDESVLAEKLLARPVTSGGGLHLVVPKDDGVLHPSQSVHAAQMQSHPTYTYA